MQNKKLVFFFIFTWVLAVFQPASLAEATSAGSAFDIDFEDTELGTYAPTEQPFKLWASSVAEPMTMKVEQEEGNRYARVDATMEGAQEVALYLINWSQDLSKDTYSETSFRLRASDLKSYGEISDYPFYYQVRMFHFDPTGGQGENWLNLFALSDDWKSILSLDANGRAYQGTDSLEYKQPVYVSETSLEDQWLNIRIIQNFTHGNIVVKIADEKDVLLTQFKIEIGSDMTSRRLKGIYVNIPKAAAHAQTGAYRRLKLDIDDVQYLGADQVPELKSVLMNYQISGPGQVMVGDVVKKNGAWDELEPNSSLKVIILPEEGYQARVMFNGETVAVGKDNAISLTDFPETSILNVSFLPEGTFIPAEQCANVLYIAKDGSDDNDGSLESPFATLEQARDTIRKYDVLPEGGVTVFLREGIYQRKETFVLEKQDGGTEEAPIVYRAYPGEEVMIDAGLQMDARKFSPVSDTMKDKLLSDAAKEHVITASLSDFGIDSMEQYPITNGHASVDYPMIIYDNERLSLARWPNSTAKSDWPKFEAIRNGYMERSSTGEGTFLVRYSTDRPNAWTHNQLEDVIIQGYFATDWYCEAQYVTVDKTEQTLEAHDSSMYGVIVPSYYKEKTRPFYFLNVYEELDQPGEFYIDRKTNRIYLYPPTDTQNPNISMTRGDFDLIRMQNVSYLTLEGLTLTGGKQNAVSVTGGTHVVIDGCDMHSFHQKAALFKNVTNSGMKNSKIYFTGIGGVEFLSGDKTNLVSGGSFFTNNLVHDFSVLKASYGPAVSLNGVGILVDHNEFYSCPHQVIYLEGVGHIMEYNVFHDVVDNAADMGVIYMGRKLTDHDNIVRYNYFYNIGGGSASSGGVVPHAVFTDDGSSDLYIYGNVFGEGLQHTQAIKTHGGQNVQVTNNLFLDWTTSFMVCDWGVYHWKESVNSSDGLGSTLAMALTKPYLERWPWVAGLTEDRIDQFVPDTDVFQNNVTLYLNKPKGNDVDCWGRNLAVSDIIGYEDNLVLGSEDDGTSIFVDYEGGDLTIRPDSIVYQTLPSFEPIPFLEMGRIMNDAAMAQQEISNTERLFLQEKNKAALGQYPQQAVERFEQALARAKATCGQEADSQTLTQAVNQLRKEYTVFVNAFEAWEEEDALALESLSLNGVAYSKFKPDTYRYLVRLKQGEAAPTVTAEAKFPKASLEITQAAAVPGSAAITVSAPGTEKKLVYTVYFSYQTDEVDQNQSEGSVPVATSPTGGTAFVGTTMTNTGGSLTADKETSRFTDVIGHWAEADINEMAARGVVVGVTSAIFEPDRPITRAELVAIIVKGLQLPDGGSAGFLDIEPGVWYESIVNAAANAGLMQGYEGYFRPEDLITREEMAVVIAKAYDRSGKEPLTGGLAAFIDREEIAPWAREFVDRAAAGLISGVSDGRFAPLENATRAQAASLLKRLLDC